MTIGDKTFTMHDGGLFYNDQPVTNTPSGTIYRCRDAWQSCGHRHKRRQDYYTYTLTSAVTGAQENNGRGDSQSAEAFAISVSIGGVANASLNVNLDDAPACHAHPAASTIADASDTISGSR